MAITLEQAMAVLAAGEKRAAEINVPSVIAVVDDGGNLKAQHRMDNASLAAIEVSLSKAYTSLATNSSTAALAEQCGDVPRVGVNRAEGPPPSGPPE
jgi:cob(I)alamin adenosyltransferase